MVQALDENEGPSELHGHTGPLTHMWSGPEGCFSLSLSLFLAGCYECYLDSYKNEKIEKEMKTLQYYRNQRCPRDLTLIKGGEGRNDLAPHSFPPNKPPSSKYTLQGSCVGASAHADSFHFSNTARSQSNARDGDRRGSWMLNVACTRLDRRLYALRFSWNLWAWGGKPVRDSDRGDIQTSATIFNHLQPFRHFRCNRFFSSKEVSRF